jgi:excisionase family DNA binding protein
MLTIRQIAERLNCSISTVYLLIESGRLTHYRCPGIRVSEEQLAEYLDSTKRGPRHESDAKPTGPRLQLKHITI